MKTAISCLPCYLRGVTSVLDGLPFPDERKNEIARALLEEMGRVSFFLSPPENAAHLYRKLAELSGIADPFSEVKKRSTMLAKKLLNVLKKHIQTFSDPFEAALRLAISGNIMDSAVEMPADEAEKRILSALSEELDRTKIKMLYEKIKSAKKILYILDNCGEAVFDRLFLDFFKEKTTLCVRGEPILNDVTRKEIAESGLGDFPVLDTGDGCPGLLLHRAPDALREEFFASDLVIAKGQGNYETLTESRGPEMALLLRAKCPAIALDLGGVPAMSMQIIFRGEESC